MEYSDLIAHIRSRGRGIVLFAIGCVILSLGLLLVSEKRYGARMDFLLVQNTTAAQDFYTQFKSVEFLGKTLSEAIYSERFISAIVETGKVNDKFLPTDKKERLETWAKLVQVDKRFDLGMIRVTVVSDRDRDAVRVVEAISEVLTTKNSLFRGGDEKSVEVRVLSGPIVERRPSIEEASITAVAGFASGLFLGTLLVVMRLPRIPLRRDN